MAVNQFIASGLCLSVEVGRVTRFFGVMGKATAGKVKDLLMTHGF